MLFEVRLPDKFIGHEVASVYIHLNFEDFKPMVMQEKIELDQEEDEPFKIPGMSKKSKTEGAKLSKAQTF